MASNEQPVAATSKDGKDSKSENNDGKAKSPERESRDKHRDRSKSPARSRSRSRGSRSRSRSRGSRSRSRSASPDYRRKRRSRSRSPPSRVDREKPEPSKILGVFGLSSTTRNEDLKDEFAKFGELDNVDLIIDKRTGRSRCFGFIYFNNMEDSIKAKESCNGMRLHGRNIRIDYSLTKRPHSPTPGQYMGRITNRPDRRSSYDRYPSSRSYSPRRRSPPRRDHYDPYEDRYYDRYHGSSSRDHY